VQNLSLHKLLHLLTWLKKQGIDDEFIQPGIAPAIFLMTAKKAAGSYGFTFDKKMWPLNL
jgi:hypothetical protein